MTRAPDRGSPADPPADRRPARPPARRGPRGSTPARARCTEQPPAVLRGGRPAHARQPAHEVGLAFVRHTGKMTPLVRRHERPLERQQLARHQSFEKERIGHPVDADAPEVPVDDRFAWVVPGPPSADGRCRQAPAREPQPAADRPRAGRARGRRGRARTSRSAGRRRRSRRPSPQRAVTRAASNPRTSASADAPVIQAPRAQGRRGTAPQPTRSCARGSTTTARRRPFTVLRSRTDRTIHDRATTSEEAVEQGERREVRQRREARLQSGIQPRRVHAFDQRRGQRHQRRGSRRDDERGAPRHHAAEPAATGLARSPTRRVRFGRKTVRSRSTHAPMSESAQTLADQ